MEPKRFCHQTAIVTGGARGMGAAHVRGLHAKARMLWRKLASQDAGY
jgi:NAD(P)-dependent dehydrogenase (short-subunit alcohol dehydrogenase family)